MDDNNNNHSKENNVMTMRLGMGRDKTKAKLRFIQQRLADLG